MNFLAHAHLARHGSDAFLLGNLIADGIKGPVMDDRDVQTASGIRFHRRMDALIDQHEITLALKRHAPKPQRRVCGIALDIVWDHFLARRAHDPALNQRVYHILETFSNDIPAVQTGMFQHLRRECWLEAYADFDFTCAAISGVGRRLSGPNRLAELTPWLHQEYALLESSFQTLWPWMQNAAREYGETIS